MTEEPILKELVPWIREISNTELHATDLQALDITIQEIWGILNILVGLPLAIVAHNFCVLTVFANAAAEI